MSESGFDPRLRKAVRSTEVPPYLEARIRAAIGETPPQSRLRRWTLVLAPAAAAALVFATALTLYHYGQFRFTPAARESYIASLSGRVASVMRVGLGDHIHCAVFGKPPHTPPGNIAGSLGATYAGLAPIAERYVPSNYPLIVAHRCKYHGREFVHLTFSGDGRLLSLMLTRRREGESFEGLLPALMQSGIPMYQAGVQRFTIDAFESRDYLVYLISDLAPRENQQILTAMAPPVKNFLEPSW